MDSGARIVVNETFTGTAVDKTITPGNAYELIEVAFLLSASATTSESATIKIDDADSNEFDQITAAEGNFLTNDMDTSQLFRFDKRLELGSSIKIAYTNTDALTIVVRTLYQLNNTVS